MTEDLEPGAPLMGRATFDMQKVRQICEGVTPGPWILERGEIMTAEEIDIDGEGDRQIAIPYSEKDVIFIAEARLRWPAAVAEIERLQKVISEPVESFGTPELIAWARKLQQIIDDFPENEHGNWPFVLEMGSHLEKFAKAWNCDEITAQAKRIAKLESALVEERARGNYFDESQECEGYWWDREDTTDYTQNEYRQQAHQQLRREGVL